MTLFNRSNRNRTAIESGRSSRIIFLITWINWAKGSTDWTYWISNFHLKNSKTWILLYQLYKTIFSKIKHYYYNLSMYIPIYIQQERISIETLSLAPPLDDEGERPLFVLNFSCSEIYGSIFWDWYFWMVWFFFVHVIFWVCVWFLRKHKKMEESSVFFRKIIKKKKKVWLCGLKVKSTLIFDVLELCGGLIFWICPYLILCSCGSKC